METNEETKTEKKTIAYSWECSCGAWWLEGLNLVYCGTCGKPRFMKMRPQSTSQGYTLDDLKDAETWLRLQSHSAALILSIELDGLRAKILQLESERKVPEGGPLVIGEVILVLTLGTWERRRVHLLCRKDQESNSTEGFLDDYGCLHPLKFEGYSWCRLSALQKIKG